MHRTCYEPCGDGACALVGQVATVTIPGNTWEGNVIRFEDEQFETWATEDELEPVP